MTNTLISLVRRCTDDLMFRITTRKNAPVSLEGGKVMFRFTSCLAVLVVVFGGSASASATTVSYTGAELLSLPEVSFPTRSPAVQGDSLRFEAGDQIYEILIRWDLFEPGSPSLSGDPVRIEVLADLTRQSSDWDALITLWDGTKAIGAGLMDNDGGGVQDWVTTSDGVHGSTVWSHNLESRGPLFSIGQSGQFALEFELTESGSQVLASGAGASLQYSTSALDLSQGLAVLVFMQHEWEQLDVNSIRVTMIPEPSTLILALFALTLLPLWRRR